MNEWIKLQTAIYKMVMWNHDERDREADDEESLSGRSDVEPAKEQVPDSRRNPRKNYCQAGHRRKC